jgi:Tfp pilus assembly protein PilE
MASAMERHYSTQVPMTYVGVTASGTTSGAPLSTFFPSSTPLDSTRVIYNLTVASSSATAFVLQAAAASGANVDSNCATMTISNTGQKTPTACWE